MKYIREFILVLSVSFSLVTLPATPAFAQTPTVSVSQSCSVTDTDSAVHSYSGQFLGICALVAAKTQGVISTYTLQNFSFGLFLASLNGISPSDTEFWNVAQNGTDASVGLSDLVLTQGDTLTFQRRDFVENTDVGVPVTFAISLQSPRVSGNSGGGQIVTPFNVSAALSFLSDMQKVDGSFGADVLTDWAAIALASADPSRAQDLVRAYLLLSVPPASSITDYERHAMALMALGINPYTGTATDYITPIVDSYDGTQVGDLSLVNDDIFALFPLPKAGYDPDDAMIQNIVAFILAKQSEDGAWEGSVDLTAAAIQALSPFASIQDVTEALAKAKKYMRDARRPDGSWENSFQASWVIQALHVANVPLSSWIQDGRSPMSTLASAQEDDGGVESTTTGEATRIWATSYAIPAALAKSWNDILQSFAKPENNTVETWSSRGSEGSIVITIATTTATTSTANGSPENIAGASATTTEQETSVSVQQNNVPPPSTPSTAVQRNEQVMEVASLPETEASVLTSEMQTAESQLAATGAIGGLGLLTFLTLPFLLVLSAILGAFAYPPLMRLFRRIFG